MVDPFAESAPLADLLGVAGEGELRIDCGHDERAAATGGSGEQQGSDHSPSGSGRPARRCAATRVLRISMAMVIGPTPPGHRRDRAGDFGSFIIGDVADQPALAILGRQRG